MVSRRSVLRCPGVVRLRVRSLDDVQLHNEHHFHRGDTLLQGEKMISRIIVELILSEMFSSWNPDELKTGRK